MSSSASRSSSPRKERLATGAPSAQARRQLTRAASQQTRSPATRQPTSRSASQSAGHGRAHASTSHAHALPVQVVLSQRATADEHDTRASIDPVRSTGAPHAAAAAAAAAGSAVVLKSEPTGDAEHIGCFTEDFTSEARSDSEGPPHAHRGEQAPPRGREVVRESGKRRSERRDRSSSREATGSGHLTKCLNEDGTVSFIQEMASWCSQERRPVLTTVAQHIKTFRTQVFQKVLYADQGDEEDDAEHGPMQTFGVDITRGNSAMARSLRALHVESRLTVAIDAGNERFVDFDSLLDALHFTTKKERTQVTRKWDTSVVEYRNEMPPPDNADMFEYVELQLPKRRTGSRTKPTKEHTPNVSPQVNAKRRKRGSKRKDQGDVGEDGADSVQSAPPAKKASRTRASQLPAENRHPPAEADEVKGNYDELHGSMDLSADMPMQDSAPTPVHLPPSAASAPPPAASSGPPLAAHAMHSSLMRSPIPTALARLQTPVTPMPPQPNYFEPTPLMGPRPSMTPMQPPLTPNAANSSGSAPEPPVGSLLSLPAFASLRPGAFDFPLHAGSSEYDIAAYHITLASASQLLATRMAAFQQFLTQRWQRPDRHESEQDETQHQP